MIRHATPRAPAGRQPPSRLSASTRAIPRGATVSAIERLESRRLLAAGDLDPTFGTAGQAIDGAPIVPTDSAVQADGKILVAGFGLGDVGSVVRLNPDGTRDASFGAGGVANAGYGMYYSVGYAVAVGPTGRVAVAGVTQAYNPSSPFEATLVVYDAQGKLDPTFNRPIGSTALGGGHGFTDVAFQSDGKVLVLGRRLIRFNADGSLDTTFGGGDGVLETMSGKQVIVQPDGRILVLGYFALFRLRSDGTPDPTFDGDGVLPSVKGSDLALAPDGDILVAGNGNYAQLVSRFNADGSIERGFGSNGNATVFGGTQVAVTAEDVFVGGTAQATAVPYGRMEITALTRAGQRDARFSGDGYAVVPPPTTLERTTMTDLGVQQGKLLAVGGAALYASPPAGATEIHPSLARIEVPGAAPVVQQPFSGTPVAVPGMIEAENFDRGGEAVAYHDTDAGNVGGALRPAEGVDLQPTADPAGAGCKVGFVRAGEWLEYTISVAAAGQYDFDVRANHLRRGGSFHIEIDGRNVTGSMAVPQTGDWDKFATVTRTGISLSAGTHLLRLAFDTAGDLGYVGNFNWVRIRGR